MRRGDDSAYEAIFRRHHQPLLSYCRHMLGSLDEAEDALQQAFIRAHRALLSENPPRELRPWLYAITRNCARTALARRRPEDPLDGDEPQLDGLSEEVGRREDLRDLVADLARLPEEQRSALLMAELEDLTHVEIADALGCPPGKVRALVYQARSALLAERAARDASCLEIREELAVARGGELRRGPLRRHLRICLGCREFQAAVCDQRRSLAIVLPVAASVALAGRIITHAVAAHGGSIVAGAFGAPGVASGLGGFAGGTGLAAAGTGASGGAAGTLAGLGSVGGAGSTAAAGSAAAAGAASVASAASVPSAALVAGAGSAGAVGSAAGLTMVASAGSSTGVGGLGTVLGAGALTKVAVGGVVASLAAVGAVAVPHHRHGLRTAGPGKPVAEHVSSASRWHRPVGSSAGVPVGALRGSGGRVRLAVELLAPRAPAARRGAASAGRHGGHVQAVGSPIRPIPAVLQPGQRVLPLSAVNRSRRNPQPLLAGGPVHRAPAASPGSPRVRTTRPLAGGLHRLAPRVPPRIRRVFALPRPARPVGQQATHRRRQSARRRLGLRSS